VHHIIRSLHSRLYY